MSAGVMQLLVVEDDPRDAAMVQAVIEMLSLSGTARFVSDGAEAIDFLKCSGVYAARNPDDRPRLVLLDLKLPRVDGFEVIRAIKSDPHLAAIAVVVFSSSQEQSDIAACYVLGANSFLVKPVQSADFAQDLRKALQYWLILNKNPE